MRPVQLQSEFEEEMVSIHASVKDATTKVRDRNRIIAGFNPRICKRCDMIN